MEVKQLYEGEDVIASGIQEFGKQMTEMAKERDLNKMLKFPNGR